jgi:DNA-binding MarR family transcriptional regulator
MNTKEELIGVIISELYRVADEYSQVEMLPIDVGGNADITPREVHTIQAVGQRESMGVTDVAVYFGVTTSAASQLVARLAGKGFIEKRQAPNSGKEIRLFLTDKGWQAFRAHERFHDEDTQKLIAHLSAYPQQQLAGLCVLLESLGAVLDERLNGA